jgi:hypothetical protein
VLTADLLAGRVPASLLDIGFLRSLPLVALALVVLLAGSEVEHRGRLAIDGLTVGVSLLLLSWLLVLSPALAAHDGGVLGAAVVASQPVIDLILVTLLASLALSRRSEPTLPVHLVGGGVALLALAGSGTTWLLSTGGYAPGHVLDAAWAVGFLLIALGAARPAGMTAAVRNPALERRAAALTPQLAVTGALLASVAFYTGGGEIHAFAVVLKCALIGLLVLRQILALQEAEEVTASLRARLADLQRRDQVLVGRSAPVR